MPGRRNRLWNKPFVLRYPFWIPAETSVYLPSIEVEKRGIFYIDGAIASRPSQARTTPTQLFPEDPEFSVYFSAKYSVSLSIWGAMATRSKRRIVASSSAQMLPDEMLTEVFLRLPVKSILRFRAVCRSWAAVLSSEEFCGLHMEKAKAASTPKLFFTAPTAGFDARAVYLGSSSGPDDDLLFTLDDIHGDFGDMTPASCRGLTLLFDALAPAYYVFNAATRAVTRLPPCQDVPSATAGLGFDAQTKEYKVVRLFRGEYLDKQRVKCEIYTLGGKHGDCWRPAIQGVPFRFCRAAEGAIAHSIQDKLLPVFAGGFLHWFVHPLFAVKRPRAGILSFSITDETFRWVQSPPFVPPGVRFVVDDGHLGMVREREVSGLHLVELAGHLCMLRDLRNASRDCSMLEIWRLKDWWLVIVASD